MLIFFGDAKGGFLQQMDSRQIQQLTRLHSSLLKLHKILLDEERKSYEIIHGPVQGSGRLLQLVMYDPWFDWLHRISEIVVQIDQALEEASSSAEEGLRIFADTRSLFRASPDPAKDGDSEFIRKYKSILQKQPAAVIAHAELQTALLPDA